MAETPDPAVALAARDAIELSKQQARDALVQYVCTLAALLAVTITCAVLRQETAMSTALGGFLGFATSGRPSGNIPRPIVAAATIGLGILAGVAGHAAIPT